VSDAIEMFPIEVLSLDQLRADPDNPQVHDDGDIARLHHSIATHGLLELPTWNRETGYLVGGHARVEVLRQMGVARCPVIVVDKDEDAEAAANLALNASYGHYDPMLTAAIIHQLEAAMVDIDDVCLPPYEIDRIIAEAERATDALIAEHAAATTPIERVSAPTPPQVVEEPPATCAACGRPLPRERTPRGGGRKH